MIRKPADRPPARTGARNTGAVLVITLLAIVVLAIIVTAFLQSMTIERLTARSYQNRLAAELAGDAAQAEATQRLARLMAENPYHGIGFIEGPGPKANEADKTNPFVPVLYAVANAEPSPTPKPHYLISGTTDEDATAIPGTLEKDKSVAVNYRNDDESPGWMGSPVDKDGKVQYRECRAGWVYVLKDASKPHQPDIKQPGYNPYVSRYAWWAEDETCKIDMLKAGNADGPGGGFRPPETKNLSDLAAKPNPNFSDAVARRPEDLDLGAAPIKNGKPLDITDKASNKAVIERLRPGHDIELPQDPRILNQVKGFEDGETLSRFYTTVSSISNELSGNGRRRVNINAIVHRDATASKIIADDIDDIGYAISGRHIIAEESREKQGLFSSEDEDTAKALLPNFGKRFWPENETSSLTGGNQSNLKTNREAIYLTKIAANIRDYIDDDSYPTFVSPTGTVIAADNRPDFTPDMLPTGTFPNIADNALMPRAIGHEAMPYLAKVGFTMNFSNGKLEQNETFSFYNPSTKDFTAPPQTYVKCFDRLRWKKSGSISYFQMPSYTLDISGFSFPAGKATVVTSSRGANTDMPSSQMTPPPSKRPTVSPDTATSHTESGVTSYEPSNRTGGNSYDVLTKMVWYGPNGYFGGFGAVTLTSFVAGSSQYTMSSTNPKKTRGNSMQGNTNGVISYTGDARSINESLTMNRNAGSNGSGALQDQARFWDDTGINLSKAVNSYITPTLWPDYTRAFNETASTTYAIVRDQPMTSIGELGHIYDPYRRKGASGNIDYARGGGRTLRIGVPDDVMVSGGGTAGKYAPDFKKAADKGQSPRFVTDSKKQIDWKNAAWRLTDVFDVILDPKTGKPDVDARLVPPQAEGKLNINSVMRDGGVALRSLLRGFKFLSGSGADGAPFGDSQLAGAPLSDGEIDRIVEAVKKYLTENGPMVERGELSNLVGADGTPLFSTSTLGGKDMEATVDRGREEIFRRLIGMLTTRSSSFTVYSVGQAIRENAAGDEITVLATSTNGTTYRLDPMISGHTRDEITDDHPKDAATGFVATKLYIHP